MKYQKGVGLIEVLVALLLLGIGILGYGALYLKAMEASSEALIRSQAVVISRGLTESIRVNPEGQSEYSGALQTYTSIIDKPAKPKVCISGVTCTAKEIALYDAYLAATSAFSLGMHLTMTDCPGTQNAINKRNCIFVAWGETKLEPTKYSQCMNNSGIYVARSNCLMMEAY